jgi:hypothetical protein
MSAVPFNSYLTASIFFSAVPGPDRKRTIRPYLFRVTYCNTDPFEVGCAMTWEVTGGRLSYQIALERERNGDLRWHCTCADAIFRAENEGRHCKHVKALLSLGRSRPQEHSATTAKAG